MAGVRVRRHCSTMPLAVGFLFAGGLLGLAVLGGCPAPPTGEPNQAGDANTAGGGGGGQVVSGTAVVFGYNDLGMHCTTGDFSEMMILPPYNNLHAQVVARSGEDPHILTSGIRVSYSVPGNTTSANKTNFWQYVNALLAVSPTPNIGLTGNGLSGTMATTTNGDWVATGIPITPIKDDDTTDPYQLATIVVQQSGTTLAQTQAVVPVSFEMQCNLCHKTPGISTATDILRAHDRLHATTLESQKPVLCARCHADPALNLPGDPNVSNLSHAMHGAHAPRMAALNLVVECYACHPGTQTQCLRDIHFTNGMTCNSCHTSMTAVADPTRRPWVDEPRCADCHAVAGHQYEQANTLFRNSKGHSGIFCESCHGSPHAITPTTDAADNVQASALQGHAGQIDTCTVCHTSRPDDAFFHSLGEGGGGD